MNVEEGKNYISRIVLKVGDAVKNEAMNLSEGLREMKSDVAESMEKIGEELNRYD